MPPESEPNPHDLLASRMGQYQQIWEDATAKMMVGSYRSEDLVEDWFKWWGHAARDMTAAAALTFGSASKLPGSATSQASSENGGGDGN